MIASQPSMLQRPMGRAVLASLGVHALALVLIPALAWVPEQNLAVETVTFTHVARIELQPRRVVQRRPPPRALAPRRSLTVVHSRATRVELTRLIVRSSASPPPDANPRLSSAPAVAEAVRSGRGNGVQATVPQATATPAREVAGTTGRNTGGYLPFGAQQPDPVLDPGVRKALIALGVHVTLVVTVGEDGKTERVEFQPSVDPSLQTRIQSLLADANWDPAVCGGGISCEGRATIRL